MKKIVRLTESDLIKIVKKVLVENNKYGLLNESLGISDDAKKLTDIISENLPRLENEYEIIIDENIGIPNIEKIIIRRRGNMNPHFNNIDSKITENGGILIFGLSPSDKSETILHEAFHGIDFIYKKGKFSKKLPDFTISTAFKLPSVWSPKYRFGTLLYLLNDEEVKAHLHGAYEEGKKFYQTLEGTKEEKRKILYDFLKKQNRFYNDYFDFSSPMELLDRLSKETLQQLTYGYFNENGENQYTMLMGIINHYFNMKPKYKTVTDSEIEKFKKLISKDLERGFNRFKKGLGRIVVKIEDEFN
jgi:hypothetical protein